ncbi:MAG TPA: hypothetical protein VF427_14910 [Noviherbaspirillum sp.]
MNRFSGMQTNLRQALEARLSRNADQNIFQNVLRNVTRMIWLARSQEQSSIYGGIRLEGVIAQAKEES